MDYLDAKLLLRFFYLSLAFSRVTMMCLGVVFFVFVLLGIFSASCICKCMFVSKLRKSSVIISPNTFYYPLPLLSFGTPGTHMLDLQNCLQVTVTQIFSNIFFCYSNCIISIALTLSLQTLFSITCSLLWSFSGNYFVLNIFSRSHISIYKYFPFLSWNFLFSCIMRVFFFMFLSTAVIDYLLFLTSSSSWDQDEYWLPFHFIFSNVK